MSKPISHTIDHNIFNKYFKFKKHLMPNIQQYKLSHKTRQQFLPSTHN